MERRIEENPDYQEIPIKELQGNPAIACLNPPYMSIESAADALFLPPEFSESERGLDGGWRKMLLPRLLNFYFPSNKGAEILQQVQLQIIDGYRDESRNPTSIANKRLQAGDDISKEKIKRIVGSHQVKPSTISMITGPSGMGKSMLIRQIMRAIGKPCYYHTNYKGQELSEVQILYLMRNVPDQCIVNAFCERFSEQVREITGENLYDQIYGATNLKRFQYISKLRAIVVNNHLGVIIIDEIQNLALNKSGGRQEVLKMIQNLRDEIGVPIILVGTYGAADLFRSHASLAQRLTEGGFHEITPPSSVEDQDWQDLCEITWDYQWVRNPIEISDDIKEALFDCSQGITRIMLNIFIMAQCKAIDSGREVVDADLIKTIYQDRFSPVHGLINALRSKDEGMLRNYEELYLAAFTEMSIKDAQYNHFDELQRQLKQVKDNELGVIDKQPETKPKQKRSKSKMSDDELYNAVLSNSCGSEQED